MLAYICFLSPFLFSFVSGFNVTVEPSTVVSGGIVTVRWRKDEGDPVAFTILRRKLETLGDQLTRINRTESEGVTQVLLSEPGQFVLEVLNIEGTGDVLGSTQQVTVTQPVDSDSSSSSSSSSASTAGDGSQGSSSTTIIPSASDPVPSPPLSSTSASSSKSRSLPSSLPSTSKSPSGTAGVHEDAEGNSSTRGVNIQQTNTVTITEVESRILRQSLTRDSPPMTTTTEPPDDTRGSQTDRNTSSESRSTTIGNDDTSGTSASLSSPPNTSVIIGSVLGGIFGFLLLSILALGCIRRRNVHARARVRRQASVAQSFHQERMMRERQREVEVGVEALGRPGVLVPPPRSQRPVSSSRSPTIHAPVAGSSRQTQRDWDVQWQREQDMHRSDPGTPNDGHGYYTDRDHDWDQELESGALSINVSPRSSRSLHYAYTSQPQPSTSTSYRDYYR